MANLDEIAHSSNSRCTKRKASPSASDNGLNSKAAKKCDGERATSSSCGGGSGGNNGGVRIVESCSPFKSRNDPNDYKVIKLSNGLRVCLISRKQSSTGSPRPFSGMSSTLPIQRDNPIIEDLRDHSPSCYLHAQMPFLSCHDDDLDCELFGGGMSKPENTSVAVVINVGGLDDPVEAQGLAHFSEHVVHYGSVKFPREEEVSELVWNFGVGNATTRQLTTSYYNNVCDLVLEKNLELFSEMLTNPSMDVDFIQREVQAIDNEFFLRQPFFRKQLLQAHVGYEPMHPLSRFWIGKLETLGGGTLKGSKQIQEVMRKNHKKNYVASAMTLTINSTKSMQELEDLTLRHFAKLRQGERQVRHETDQKDSKSHKLKLQKKERHIFIQGISSRAELSLIWHLPSSIYLENDSNEKTMQVIQLLLANSSPKGLLAHLKNEKLIWGANVYQSSTPYAILLEINFMLTEKGRSRESTNLIQKATQEYIKFLQGMTDKDEMNDFFQQIRIAQLREFHYGSQVPTLETTKDCAMRLQYVERPQEILNFDSWHTAKFTIKPINEALGRMTGEDPLIPGVTVIQTLPKQSSLEEKLAEIQARPMPQIKEAPYTKARYFEVIKEPINIRADFSGAFSFPRVSPYLERDLRLLSPNLKKHGGAGDMPEHKVWHLIPPENYGTIQQQKLSYRSQVDHPGSSGIPKVNGVHLGHLESSLDPYRCNVSIQFVTPPQRSGSPRGTALSWLWALCIRQSLATYTTEFALAGYDFAIQQQAGTLIIQIRGFPKYMEDVSKKILSKVFDCPITENSFNLAKEEIKYLWENYLGESGILTKQLISMILFAQNDLTSDSLGILEELTIKDLESMIKAHRVSTFAVIYLMGNVPVNLFHSLASILDRMDFGPFMDIIPGSLKYLIPLPNIHSPGETCVRLKNRANCAFTNTVTNLYILGRNFGNGHHQSECFETAMKFINQQAFVFLRTRHQLAYVVNAGSIKFKGLRDPLMIITVGIVATAKKHTPCELDQKIDEFLSEYGDYLNEMSDDIYNKMAELRGFRVTKNEVAEWFDSKFGPDFRHKDRRLKCLMRGIRKVSIQEIGCGNPVAETKICNCEACGGIREWVKGRNHESYLEFAVGDRHHNDYYMIV